MKTNSTKPNLSISYNGYNADTAIATHCFTADQDHACREIKQIISNSEQRSIDISFSNPFIHNDKTIKEKTGSLLKKFFNEETAENIKNHYHDLSHVTIQGYDLSNDREVSQRKRSSIRDSIKMFSDRNSVSENVGQEDSIRNIDSLMHFLAQFPQLQSLDLLDCKVAKEELKTILQNLPNDHLSLKISSRLTDNKGINHDLTSQVLEEIRMESAIEIPQNLSIEIMPVQTVKFRYDGQRGQNVNLFTGGDQINGLTKLNELLGCKSTRLESLSFARPITNDATHSLANDLLSGQNSSFPNLNSGRVVRDLKKLSLTQYDFALSENEKIESKEGQILPPEGTNLRALIDFLKKAKNLEELDLSNNNLSIKEINCILYNVERSFTQEEQGSKITQINLCDNKVSFEENILKNDGRVIAESTNYNRNFKTYQNSLTENGVEIIFKLDRSIDIASEQSSFQPNAIKPSKPQAKARPSMLEDNATASLLLTLDGQNSKLNLSTLEQKVAYFEENKNNSSAIEHLTISNLNFEYATSNDFLQFLKFLEGATSLKTITLTDNQLQLQQIRDIIGHTRSTNISLNISEQNNRFNETVTDQRLQNWAGSKNFDNMQIQLGDFSISWPKKSISQEQEGENELSQSRLERASATQLSTNNLSR